MSHEVSETIQGPDGRWYNVNGRTRQPLQPRLPTERQSYDTMEEAVDQARKRSRSFDQDHGGDERTKPKPGSRKRGDDVRPVAHEAESEPAPSSSLTDHFAARFFATHTPEGVPPDPRAIIVYDGAAALQARKNGQLPLVLPPGINRMSTEQQSQAIRDAVEMQYADAAAPRWDESAAQAEAGQEGVPGAPAPMTPTAPPGLESSAPRTRSFAAAPPPRPRPQAIPLAVYLRRAMAKQIAQAKGLPHAGAATGVAAENPIIKSPGPEDVDVTPRRDQPLGLPRGLDRREVPIRRFYVPEKEMPPFRDVEPQDPLAPPGQAPAQVQQQPTPDEAEVIRQAERITAMLEATG